MVLLEKLNKLEGAMAEQGAVLGRIQDVTAHLESGSGANTRGLSQPVLSPTQRRGSRTFQVPRDTWMGLDHFLSQPFIRALMPTARQSYSLVCDSSETRKGYKLPNLQKSQVQKLVQRFIEALHPVYPVVELATIERLQQRLDEDGLGWTGEDAIIMQILALGALSCGEDPNEYIHSANRRLGLACEKVDILAIQVHYLQGYTRWFST
jgi:hypothetical protein